MKDISESTADLERKFRAACQYMRDGHFDSAMYLFSVVKEKAEHCQWWCREQRDTTKRISRDEALRILDANQAWKVD